MYAGVWRDEMKPMITVPDIPVPFHVKRLVILYALGKIHIQHKYPPYKKHVVRIQIKGL